MAAWIPASMWDTVVRTDCSLVGSRSHCAHLGPQDSTGYAAILPTFAFFLSFLSLLPTLGLLVRSSYKVRSFFHYRPLLPLEFG